MCLVIDVQRYDPALAKKNKPALVSVGHAILPIFNSQEYVLSDSYILPLFSGPVDAKTMEALAGNDDGVAKALQKMLKKGELKVAKWRPSVLVRLMDGQLAASGGDKDLVKVSNKFYKPELLPRGQEERKLFGVAYPPKKNPAFDRSHKDIDRGKAVKALVPKKEDFEDWYADINKAIADETQIMHYSF
jgi:hypothetical protein